MLSAIRFLLSPSRLRFMYRYANPAISELGARLDQFASPQARPFIKTLLRANAEFLAHAFSPSGALYAWRGRLSAPAVGACLVSMLIYSVNLFARTEMAQDGSELLSLLSRMIGVTPKAVMLRRDALRKTPRSEEWLLYTWLLKDLGAPAPKFDAAVEQAFGYQYLSYIGQYKTILEKNVPGSAA
jgi:hypothetical protein